MCDLHEPFRAAFDAQLPHASQVADPFHVMAVATRVIGRVRRRVQNTTAGDPQGEVAAALATRECLRELYTSGTSPMWPPAGSVP